MSNCSPFKWRHFDADIILLCVRWYLRYSLSYRDLEEMMGERGLSVDHTTIYRWVQRYALELEKRCRPHLRGCVQSSFLWPVEPLLFTRFERKCAFCTQPLIPTRVLTSISKLGKGGHRTETRGIGFELSESFTDLVNHLIEGCKGQSRQVLFAQLFPHMFNRIDRWTVGRLPNQSHMGGNLELF